MSSKWARRKHRLDSRPVICLKHVLLAKLIPERVVKLFGSTQYQDHRVSKLLRFTTLQALITSLHRMARILSLPYSFCCLAHFIEHSVRQWQIMKTLLSHLLVCLRRSQDCAFHRRTTRNRTTPGLHAYLLPGERRCHRRPLLALMMRQRCHITPHPRHITSSTQQTNFFRVCSRLASLEHSFLGQP